jgi:hypothetical protein
MGKDPSSIRREIERTRARLGDTIEALGYKADVRARVKDAVSERVETVRGTIVEAAAGIQQTVAGASGALGGALSSATEKMGDATGGVTANLTETMSAVGEKLPRPQDVRDAARRGAGIAAENPLGLVFGALAAGFVLGLMLPVSDYERKTVGPIRDDLLERAKDAGTDALVRGGSALLS